MSTYIALTNHGADVWRESVNLVADLPTLGSLGQVRLVRSPSPGQLYIWDGSAWNPTAGGATTISGLTAITDGVAAVAGAIGEILSSTQALTTTGMGATGLYGNSVSLVLTAGAWVIQGVAIFSENTATELSDSFKAGISTDTNGASLTDFEVTSDNHLISSNGNLHLTVPPKLVNISAGDTYYLNTQFTYTGGTPQHGGSLTARRFM